MTASDVAAHVGLSRSAVSRAFTEGASIHPDKRQRILAAAKELGYQPNFFARTLSTPAQRKCSNLVAILTSDFSNPYQSYLFEELSTALQLSGKQPMLLNVKQAEDLDQAILRLSGYQVDGVIAVMGSLPAASFSQCLKLSLPLVTMGRADERGRIPSVQTDNYRAGQLAAQHLLEAGLTRLGFVCGRADGQASIERLAGFGDALTEHRGDAPQVLHAGRYGYSAGFEVATRELEVLRRLEGVFCASDALAMGLLDSCREVANLNVPRQLRVIGCDDVPQAAWQGYQLSTVAQPVADMVAAVLSLLEKQWQGLHSELAAVRVAPSLVLRRT